MERSSRINLQPAVCVCFSCLAPPPSPAEWGEGHMLLQKWCCQASWRGSHSSHDPGVWLWRADCWPAAASFLSFRHGRLGSPFPLLPPPPPPWRLRLLPSSSRQLISFPCLSFFFFFFFSTAAASHTTRVCLIRAGDEWLSVLSLGKKGKALQEEKEAEERDKSSS